MLSVTIQQVVLPAALAKARAAAMTRDLEIALAAKNASAAQAAEAAAARAAGAVAEERARSSGTVARIQASDATLRGSV